MTTEFNQQVAEAVYDSALKVLEKTAPHFNPITYECISIVNCRPVDRYTWVDPELSDDADLMKSASFAQGYRTGRFKFYLDHLDAYDLDADDVMIVIVGIAPMNESVPYWDANTLKFVYEDDDTRPVMAAHVFFQSALKYVPID